MALARGKRGRGILPRPVHPEHRASRRTAAVETILVVDDNPATLHATSRVLKAAGFEVLLAALGEEAVKAACEHAPDVIVLDVDLPDIDGFEVVRRVRAEPRVARVPIIHLSATFVTDRRKVQGLEGGADGYLTHPVEPPVLVASIHAFLRARLAEEAMRRSEERFKAVFEQALDGIALLSQDLIFIDVNPAMCQLLKRSREELAGKHASALSPRGLENEIGHLAAIVTREGSWRGVLPLLAADGRKVDLDWRISRHSAPDVRLAIVSDVTQRQALDAERELLLARESQARGEAERANRLKDEFLATLSHELRSPLNAIVGWTQVLQRRANDEGAIPPSELSEALDVIERNARLQTQLIGDLLDVSRITSGKMRLDIETLDPAGPVEAAVEGVRPAAEAKNIRLELDLDHDAGPVLGDAARLQQVFWNLLSNAVKFTPREGTVSIRVRRAQSQVEVAVRDTGRGMQPDFVPHVFERFRQEESAPDKTQGGLGLGLAIVRHLIELHGGSVSAHSEGEGLGATFLVSLPVSAVRYGGPLPAGGADGGAHSGPRSVRLKGLRVLVVDDDADSRELLVRVLVSDIGMPGSDGYALIQLLRERGFSAKELPAIAVSGLARAEDRQQGLAAGYDFYFAKPVDVEGIVEAVAAVTERQTIQG